MNIFNDKQLSVIAALTENYWDRILGDKLTFLPEDMREKYRQQYFIDIVSGLEDETYWDELLDGVDTPGADGVE